MYPRVGRLGNRPSHWAPGILVFLLLFPMGSAQAIGEFFPSAGNFAGRASTVGLLEGFSISASSSEELFLLSGQATITVESLTSPLVAGPIGTIDDTNTEQFEELLEETVVEIKETGDLLLAGRVESKFGAQSGQLASKPDIETWTRSLHAPYESPEIDESQFVSIESPVVTYIKATGSFSLSFWDGQFTVNGNEYWAGERHQFEAEGVAIGESTSQIIHMEITNGSIEAYFIETPVKTYWSQATLQGTNAITFQDAKTLTGELLGDIESEGEWSFDVTRNEGLEVSNLEADTLTVGGTVVQTPQTAWYWWLLVVPVLVLVVLGIRPPAGTIVKRMERDLEAGRYLQVAGYKLARILKSKHAGRASLYRATSLLAMEQFQEAGLFLQSINTNARPDPATYHLLYANALAGIGSKDEAARELAACIALVPSYANEARNIPLLAPLLGRAHTLRPDYV